ncbi:MAG: alpha-ribazole phosphatase family protein [Prevotella sp.]
MEIVMIRHTRVNVPPGTCYGQTDVDVADTFEQEAEVTKKNLAVYGAFDAVYASPLGRARKLAAFCGYPQPLIDDRLKEISMGDWEMMQFDSIRDERLQDWYDNFMNVAPTNGESYPMLYERVASFLDELRTKSYSKVAVFAHGGVLMCAGVYAGLFDATDCMKHLVDCGGLQKITI